MSIIVLVRRNGMAVLAADSATYVSGNIRVPGGLKVHETTSAVIGYTGDAVLGDLLAAYFRGGTSMRQIAPDATANGIFDFGLSFRRWLKETAHLIDDKPAEGSCFAHFGGQVMVLTDHGGGFVLGGDLSVDEIAEPGYWAIGSGREVALGALAVLSQLANEFPEGSDATDVRNIAIKAVEVACSIINTCDLPVKTWVREIRR